MLLIFVSSNRESRGFKAQTAKNRELVDLERVE